MEKTKGNGNTEEGKLYQMRAQRDYKDRLFRMIFREKSALLSLYNAVNETDYTDPEALEIVTLENAIYMNMKNDLAFVVDFYLNLYEHQSTFSPNMPLRNLFYISRELQAQVDTDQLYRNRLVKIPTPRFLVFYNGTEKQPERQTLRLSNAFIQPMEQPELELVVTILNINTGNNQKLLEKCRLLKEYMQYVERIRKYVKDFTLEEAVNRAVEECVQEDILKDFLTKYRNEAIEVSIYEYNEEQALKYIREDEYQKGKLEGEEIGQKRGEEIGQKRGEEIGQKRGEEIGRKQGEIRTLVRIVCRKLIKGRTPEVIAEELEEEVSVIETICKAAEEYAPEYDCDMVYEKLEKQVK